MGVDVVAVLAVFNEAEGVVFFDLLHRASGGIVVVGQGGRGKSAHAHKFLIGVIHRALGERDGRTGDKETNAVLVGHDFQIRGVHDFHGIGEVGHQVGDIEAVLGDFLRDALYNVLRQDQRLVSVDHDIQIGLHHFGDLIEPLRGGLAVGGGHKHLGAEALGYVLDFLAVSGHIDLLKAGHFLAVLPHPIDHGVSADIGQRLVVITGRPATSGNHTDDFHFSFVPFSFFFNCSYR